MEENKNKFKVINDLGEEVECRVLFTFDSKETNKSYLVYTDDTKTEDDQINVYASIYDPTGESEELIAVESEKEWNLINTVLSEIVDKNNKEKENNEN